MILTPDQRLRVFISSTLRELAAERAAAAGAIKALRLVPVMFEAGARPHPPRDLYRAYLEQSHVFVGIYGREYGWVAPDMEVSGLEDEYLLARELPKLLYLKRSSEPLDDRLRNLIARFETDDTVSYKPFETAEELEEMLQDDLALMLTERFERGVDAVPGPAPARGADLPTELTPLVGRTEEISAIRRSIEEGSRLITVIGPGGVGKTRVVLAAARSLENDFPEGVYFSPLSSVDDPERVAAVIAQSVGLRLSSGEAPVAAIKEVIASRRVLLVVDNFEHVVSAATVISELLADCPQLRILLTSRAPLQLQGEARLPVAPLEVPADGSSDASADAVRLFVDRASAARPGLELSAEDLRAVADIVRLLDGLPLALELAAARVRLIPPRLLLQKLKDDLSSLPAGPRDMPDRHRTLQATIRWSYELLTPEERILFARLGVFPGGFSLDAVETICGFGLDAIEGFASLLDKSMVRVEVTAQDEPRFVLLRTIREYAAEWLGESLEADTLRERHARFYLNVADEASDGLRSSLQREWTRRLEADMDNLRTAMSWALERESWGLAAAAAWSLWLFWWASGHLEEGRTWMDRIVAGDTTEGSTRARALAVQGVMAFWMGDVANALPAQLQALEMFEAYGDSDGTALVGISVGLATALMGDGPGGRARVISSRRHLLEAGDRWGAVMALNVLCWLDDLLDEPQRDEEVYRSLLAEAEQIGADIEVANALANNGYYWNFSEDHELAYSYLARSLQVLHRLRNKGSAWYILERAAEVLVRTGRAADAAQVLGASQTIKDSIGALPVPPAVAKLLKTRAAAIAELGEEAFDDAYARGSRMSFDEVMEFAIGRSPALAG